MQTIKDIDLKGKRVLIRQDFNVPLDKGRITHDARIKAAIPTIEYALKQDAQVILMSHLGRPTEGQWDESFSLAPVAKALEQYLKIKVVLVKDYQTGLKLKEGEIPLLENTRFLVGEKANDETLAKQLASLCDVFVMDAFSVAHRAQASTVGVATFAPVACAGFLLEKEVQALTKAIATAKHPLVAIVGGSKVSTKFRVLDKLLETVDTLILGGGMANTFLKAQGYDVGASLYEEDWTEQATQLIKKAQSLSKNLVLPKDVCVSQEVSEQAKAFIRGLDEVEPQEKILDIGPESIKQSCEYIDNAQTIVWNGPVGVFEVSPFKEGTMALARAVAQSKAFSVAGGGDTLAAIDAAGVGEQISYQSTAGGAFLEFLEGRQLPGLEVLKTKS